MRTAGPIVSSRAKGSLVSRRSLVIAAGAGGLVLCFGVLWVATIGSSQEPEKPSFAVSTTRPTETIRVAKPPGAAAEDKSGRTAGHEVPPPQGTIRRMDAISSSFSKR